MTNLHPIAIRVLSMPGWRLRVWLAVVITLVLAGLPLPIAGLTLWVSALPYMMMTETLARMVGEGHRARRQLQAEHERQARLLTERDGRISALEADLAQACSSPRSKSETAEEAVYKLVGLHPRAPNFLVFAARRAYRTALHPDRNPKHREQAHLRFVQAEAAFDQISGHRHRR